MINEIEQSGQLAPCQNMGVITLLYKAGDRTDLSNWRPITVLNADYKIIEKVLGHRLKNVLDRIIHSDQKAYLKNRQIGENVRLNEDIIYYCEAYNKPGAVMYVDQSKAFDRVNQEWMLMVLEHYGFGEKFRKWINILYKNAKSAIFTNGFLSECVHIERGVRQGSPLGPYLYILQSEPLAQTIRNDVSIKGISIPGSEHEIKLAAFADDTQGYISTMESIDRWIYHLDVYSKASGAVINADKTSGTLLGTLKNDHSKDHLIRWDEGPIKALGVNQGTNKDEVEFWRKKIVKMKQQLNMWKMRGLTLTGKTYLLRSVGLSTLLYAAEIQAVPKHVKTEVEDIIWNFIWDGKIDKVKRDICMRTVSEGGINAPDFASMIKVSRLKMLSKMIAEGEETWKILPRFFLGVGSKSCLLETKEGHGRLPAFYKECVDAWHELKCEKKPKLKTIIDWLKPADENILSRQSKIEIKLPDEKWCSIEQISKSKLQSVIKPSGDLSKNEIMWEQLEPKIDWPQVYDIMSLKTLSRKAREFHWKIINRAVYTESKLKHWVDSDGTCCLCGSEEETLMHMLVECEMVEDFWVTVIRLIRKHANQFQYSDGRVILGCTNLNTTMSRDEQTLANTIILNAKWIVWKRRCIQRYEGVLISQQNMYNWLIENMKCVTKMVPFLTSAKTKAVINNFQL